MRIKYHLDSEMTTVLMDLVFFLIIMTIVVIVVVVVVIMVMTEEEIKPKVALMEREEIKMG